MDSLKKEQRIMVVMRKVLSNIVKDTTPPSQDMRHPLSDNTIQDIRDAFSLISAREREIAEALGLDESRPGFTDEVQTSKVVPIDSIGRNKK
jgi:hypothetical protein